MERIAKGYVKCMDRDGKVLECIDIIEGQTIHPPAGTTHVRPVSYIQNGEIVMNLGENKEVAA